MDLDKQQTSTHILTTGNIKSTDCQIKSDFLTSVLTIQKQKIYIQTIQSLYMCLYKLSTVAMSLSCTISKTD